MAEEAPISSLFANVRPPAKEEGGTSVSPPTPEGAHVADETLYHNGYHHIRDDHDDHDSVLLGQSINANGSAARDVADAGRDLTSAVGDAGRDLINASFNGTQHGNILDAIRDAQAHVQHEVSDGLRDTVSGVSGAHRDILREAASVREEVGQQGKENIVGILDQGSRGRETTLAQAAEIRNDIADAHSQNLLAHCETQKLVIKEHCETREAVREEGVRTREVVVSEHRALLERELAAKGEENTLLKLQLNLLSGGGIGGLKV